MLFTITWLIFSDHAISDPQLIQVPKTESLRVAEANIVNIICLKQGVSLPP